ncbi:MAG: hypothetical protein ACJ8AG_05665 [Ktedonobacteraceae bacterium]
MQLQQALAAQQVLIQAIQQEEQIDQHILDAFSHIPRHEFVPEFYERVPNNKHVAWRQHKQTEIHEDAWLQLVYRDAALTTRLDANGFPGSSSSMPSIMAAMLQALQIKRGQRVLEIGTGTGYNAALLAYLVGDPHLVTTIDVEKELVELAEPAITCCTGPGMAIIAGDGLRGVESNAPYDRIIATGSYPNVPQPWLDQLAPGGLLLMNLQRNLANIMLLLKKDGKGAIAGKILPIKASFMPLHDGTGAYYRCPVPHEPIEPVLQELSSPPSFQPSNLSHKEFGFFLQCHLPQARRSTYTDFQYLEDPSTQRLIQFYQGTVRGSQSLWQELLAIDKDYRLLGCPKRQDFSYEIDTNHQHVITYKDRCWII